MFIFTISASETMSISPERDRELPFDSNSPTGLNELADKKKRPSSEATEYPRRRATIAVCIFTMLHSYNSFGRPTQALLTIKYKQSSAKYVVYGKLGATEHAQGANSAPTLMQNASTGNPA